MLCFVPEHNLGRSTDRQVIFDGSYAGHRPDGVLRRAPLAPCMHGSLQGHSPILDVDLDAARADLCVPSQGLFDPASDIRNRCAWPYGQSVGNADDTTKFHDRIFRRDTLKMPWDLTGQRHPATPDLDIDGAVRQRRIPFNDIERARRYLIVCVHFAARIANLNLIGYGAYAPDTPDGG